MTQAISVIINYAEFDHNGIFSCQRRAWDRNSVRSCSIYKLPPSARVCKLGCNMATHSVHINNFNQDTYPLSLHHRSHLVYTLTHGAPTVSFVVRLLSTQVK